MIRFAFKRLPDQEPLVNGKGDVILEPDYDSDEWKKWEGRLTDQRAYEVVEIKKEESPTPENRIFGSSLSNGTSVFIKTEDDY